MFIMALPLEAGARRLNILSQLEDEINICRVASSSQSVNSSGLRHLVPSRGQSAPLERTLNSTGILQLWIVRLQSAYEPSYTVRIAIHIMLIAPTRFPPSDGPQTMGRFFFHTL